MLTGAHRTGKTTLAKAFSEHSGIPFAQTTASAVFAEMGLDAKVDYPMSIRLEIQKRILDAFEKQCRPHSRSPFITDRTPIDFVAYTLADIQRGNISSSLNGDIERYVDDCISVSNSIFPILMVVQPGIPLVEAEGKAPASMPYIEHLNYLIMGIVNSEAVESANFYIPRNAISIEERIACIENSIIRAEQRFKRQIEQSVPSLVFH